ncbi:MAG: hypothetical protein ACYCSQ_08160 [bacterium]
MKKIKLIFLAMILFGAINFLSGCALLLVGGLAGTTGYLAAKQGYKVQSPVTKR